MANTHTIQTRTSPFGYYATCADCGAITSEYYPTAEAAWRALRDSIRAFARGPVEFKS